MSEHEIMMDLVRQTLELEAKATEEAITDFFKAEGRWPEFAWCIIEPVDATIAVHAFASDDRPTNLPPGVTIWGVGMLNDRTIAGEQ